MRFPFAFLVAASLLLTVTPHAGAFTKGKPQPPGTADLKPGDYIWQPDAAPTGALDIVVSLGQQQLWVYRNGVQIGRSTISSGRPGYETPKGVYMILEKNRTHHSNKYHEASMPYMNRLTWGGLAIHAGNTPPKPESHGCMHVPEDFSKDLYGSSDEGNTVLIVDGTPRPQDAPGVNALFNGPDTPPPKPTPTPAPDASPAGSPTPPPFVWKPEDAKTGPYLVVFSVVDKRVYVYRKGIEIGRADLGGVDGKGLPTGKHVYVALDKTLPKGGHAWSALGSTDGAKAPEWQRIGKRWSLPAEFRQKLREIVGPGTTVVLTDEAADNAKPDKADKED